MTGADGDSGNFWESAFKDAYDEEGNFLSRYEDSARSYPRQEVLGMGGVKTIYKSFDWKTEREISLAVPKDESHHDASLEFIHEAIVLGRLEHPNIIPVYDTGLDEEKVPYFTMKYLEGKNLDLYLQDWGRDQSFLKRLPNLLEIFKKVCLAVSYAHSKNIVHLDIKPSNVLIGEYGEVFLCDWGLSKEINRLESDVKLANLSGTPGYLAPERLQKVKPAKTMDVYSLGCLLYFLLSNKSPLDHEELTVFIESLKGNQIKPLHEVSEDEIPNSLVQIFEKCCQEDPDQRYSEVNDILEDLNLYTNGYATKAENAGFIRNLHLLYKRNFYVSNLILAFIFIITLTTLVYIENLKEQTRIAIEEKTKSEKLAQTLSLKKEENQEFIDILLETADKNFRKNRLTSTQYILEDILFMPIKHDEVQFRLAKISIGQFKWKKAQRSLESMKEETPESRMLLEVIKKYKNAYEAIGQHFQLSREVHEMGFVNLYQNLSADLIVRDYSKKEKLEHILSFIRLDNQFNDEVILEYDSGQNQLLIKDAELIESRMFSALKLDRLIIHNSQILDSPSNYIMPKHLDLQNSVFIDEFKINLDRMKRCILPSNKLKMDLTNFSELEKLVLPKDVYLKSDWEEIEKIIEFY